MTYIVAALALCAAMGLLKILNVVPCARTVLDISNTAMKALADKSLSDDDKERISRTSSVQLFGLFLRISSMVTIAFGAPLLVVWLFDLAGTPMLGPVLDALASWPFILGAVVLGVAVIVTGKRKAREL